MSFEQPVAGSAPEQSAEKPRFDLDINPDFENFKSVEVTKYDETKPWKPALEVKLTKSDGSVVEGVNAESTAYAFKDAEGKSLLVSIEAAGHIDDMHIHAKEPGSKFEQSSLSELMHDIATHLPEDVMERKGISIFDMEMGKYMGLEGVASMDELKAEGVLTEQDIATALEQKVPVYQLNKSGSMLEKKSFIEYFRAAHPECKVQFQLVRETVLVPVVDASKRPTTKLFMMMGPNSKDAPSMFTVAPGRDMPRHPNPGQHTDKDKNFNEVTFKESADAWFDTVMLTGK